MNQSRILILDEDEEMRFLIAGQISAHEYHTEQAGSFPEAIKILRSGLFSLLLLDSKIPEYSATEMLTAIRAELSSEQLSILILAPHGSEQDQAHWQKLGADDFLFKPFDRGLLLSKIKTLIRKVCPVSERLDEKPNQLTRGDLTLDLKSFDVFCHGERLHLTPNEFKLLQALLSHPGAVLSRDRLIELVQGYGIAVIDRAVDTHIFSLRKKLGVWGESIETIRGSGYRISPELA